MSSKATHGKLRSKLSGLTTEGQKLLNFTEDSVNFICRKLALEAEVITVTAVLAQK